MPTAAIEYWMRGPIDGVPALLQPVAHALLQAREEIRNAMDGFPEALLYERPGDVASPAFHLQHIAGVLDRLFTYANNQALNQQQLSDLAAEGKPGKGLTLQNMLSAIDRQVEISIDQLKTTDEKSLTAFRGVGRKQLPSTVAGLYFHAAEHSMRHLGQLLVTVRIIKASA